VRTQIKIPGFTAFLASGLTVTALGLAAAPAVAIPATTAPVINTTADQSLGDCSVTCSLRDAVALSNFGDTLQVPAGHYVLTLGEITTENNLTIVGAGARSTILDGNGASRIFHFNNLQRLQSAELDDLSLINGLAATQDPRFRVFGGGALTGAGNLMLRRCRFASNQAAAGGAIFWDGDVTIDQCTIASNHAIWQPNSPNSGGGGVFAEGGVVAITNSTLTGNTSSGNAPGGGAVMFSPLLFNLVNVTVTANQASGGGGLFVSDLNGVGSLANSIVADNLGGDCFLLRSGVASDHSLDSDNSCGLADAGSHPGVPPLLGPLANNGGPTDTHALLAGSPALNAGNNATCLATDQRGVTRPQGPASDIGAYELLSNVPPVIASDNASVTVNEGQTAANTGTVSDADGDPLTLTASLGTVANNGNGTWSWSFANTEVQNQTVTISANDGHGHVSTTSFGLVVNNAAPVITSVSNNGPIIAGGSATITVAATDPAGSADPLTYEFDCNRDGVFEIGPQAGNSATCTFASAGTFTVNARVTDDEGAATTGSTLVTVSNVAPDCSHAVASPDLLWPPNHQFAPIQILGVTNQEGGAVAIKVTSIFQDEKVGSGKKWCDSGEDDDRGDKAAFSPLIFGKHDGDHGNNRVDGKGVGTGTALVRAERSCKGDGRVYHISFTATNAQGLSCTGAVTVGVARKKNVPPVDGGALFDSTKPATDQHGQHGD
jgi:CSLREA domain-containing protein